MSISNQEHNVSNSIVNNEDFNINYDNIDISSPESQINGNENLSNNDTKSDSSFSPTSSYISDSISCENLSCLSNTPTSNSVTSNNHNLSNYEYSNRSLVRSSTSVSLESNTSTNTFGERLHINSSNIINTTRNRKRTSFYSPNEDITAGSNNRFTKGRRTDQYDRDF